MARSGRLEALLTIAFGQRLEAEHLRQIAEAQQISRSGHGANAGLRLALSGRPWSTAPDDLSTRISTAEALVANGMASEDFIRELGLAADYIKYDPDQPRVPPGHGNESGRWTVGDATSGSTRSANTSAMAIALRAAPLLAPELGATALAALATLAAGIGFAATLGVLFVPTPNGVSSSGALPGSSGNSYDYNKDEGLLRVFGSEGEVLAAGHKDRAGVFFDADTGIPFARAVGGSLVFDGAVMAATREKDGTEAAPSAVPRTETEDNEPKLCPDPGPDQPGSEYAKERAQKYQEQISRMINPQRPLKYGLAMNLTNPATGKVVHYDECDERTGTMIEAKGPGFDGVLSFPQGAAGVEKKWLDQSSSQVRAAGSREVVWYFAEQDAAEHAKQLFSTEGKGRERITIRIQPADKP